MVIDLIENKVQWILGHRKSQFVSDCSPFSHPGHQESHLP